MKSIGLIPLLLRLKRHVLSGITARTLGLLVWSGSVVAQPAALEMPPLSQFTAQAGPMMAPSAVPANPLPRYTLDRLLQIARTQSPLLAVSRSEELAARAGITTARTLPNPELEFGIGNASGRAGSPSGVAPMLGIAQPLENPRLRQSRLQTAEARVDVAISQTALTQVQIVAEVKRRFLDVARLKEELQAFQEDLRLTDQIRQRVQVRVRTGEAPRFDLIRADTEMAVAQKNVDMAQLQLRQALGFLRQIIGPQLEPQFDLQIDPAELAVLEEREYDALRAKLLAENADVALARRELDRARRQIDVEQALIMPQVVLRASQERDPSVTINRIGASIQIPLLNRREGPIAEAQALAERARLSLEQREFEASSGFEVAWQAYRAAASQVNSLETNIIERSRSVIQVAEAAYRFGERGILEFLDAQRQFRLVRNELIQARFSARLARVELERLAGAR